MSSKAKSISRDSPFIKGLGAKSNIKKGLFFYEEMHEYSVCHILSKEAIHVNKNVTRFF